MARRSPVATLAIIAMLALGTGGVTAVFNPIYSMLFAPLPFPQPDRLMIIGGDIEIFNTRSQRFEREDELDRIFSSLASYVFLEDSLFIISDTGNRKDLSVVDVSPDFFRTLGIQPLHGSDFSRETEKGVIISNRFWKNELMGADDAVGKIIRVNSGMFRIVGIMPESFDFPSGVDIWYYRGVGDGGSLNTARRYIGRLRLGMSVGHAAEEIRSMNFKPVAKQIAQGVPLLQPLQTFLYGDRRPMLWMLGSAAVLFLLLVCAGVMNLLVMLGSRRRSEMANRLIFGATRRNLVFQLLRETLPLVIVGALAGLWVSGVTGAWLMARFPGLKGSEVAVPVKMVFFTVMIFAVTIIGGLTPALYASGVNLNTYLKSGGDYKRRFLPFSMREYLTGLQLSLSLALLTGVGLLLSSLAFHVDVPLRWSSRDVAVVRVVSFPASISTKSASPGDLNSYAAIAKEATISQALFLQDLQQNLSTMPEVVSAGIFSPIPYSQQAQRAGQSPIPIYKNAGDPVTLSIAALVGHASPEGFDALGIKLLSGRFFTLADMAYAIETADFFSIGGTVIINETLARQFWPGENPVGKTIYDMMQNPHEIAGVVRDYHQGIGDNKSIVPAMYLPAGNNGTFLVRLHSRALMKDFRQRLSDLESGGVSLEIHSLDEIVSGATANIRLTLQLLGGFALLGIIVSGLGVYATTSLMIAAMNREIGIRMALGAQTWDILRLSLWRGTRAVLLGLPFGLFLAWILSRMLSGYLFQVKIDDSLAWVISCAALLSITIIAALIPAARACRVNPMDVLRNG